MSEMIEMEVLRVLLESRTDELDEWICRVEFGISGDPDNPWLTVDYDDLERIPCPGDVLRVLKPKVMGFAEKKGGNE